MFFFFKLNKTRRSTKYQQIKYTFPIENNNKNTFNSPFLKENQQ